LKKTLERAHSYFAEEEIVLDLGTQESAELAFHKISGDAYARGELAVLIWIEDSKSLNYKGKELIKWRMNTLMDFLDGKLSYESLVPIPTFCD